MLLTQEDATKIDRAIVELLEQKEGVAQVPYEMLLDAGLIAGYIQINVELRDGHYYLPEQWGVPR